MAKRTFYLALEYDGDNPPTAEELTAALAETSLPEGLEELTAGEGGFTVTVDEKVGEALAKFADTVEATGGVRRDRQGNYHPLADDEWTDLGDAYVIACKALDKKPIVVR